MADPNVTVYIAVRELQQQVNAQQQYIVEFDNMLRKMFADNGLLGFAARKLLQLYCHKNKPPSTENIRAIEIPPVLPNTLEVVIDDDDSGGTDSAKTSNNRSRVHPVHSRRRVPPHVDNG